jgi:hypothetical protein
MSNDERVMVFRLGDLTPLDRPVTNDGNRVRGARYTSLDALGDATVLTDLEP